MERIPGPLALIVGEILGSYYYSHRRINALFIEKGAPGEPPEGSCVEKCATWLKRASADPQTDALKLLGGVLEEMMEVDHPWDSDLSSQRKRIAKILERHGMVYQQGGRILGADMGMPTRSLQEILRARDLPALEVEFQRARDNLLGDPPACITACCAILEALCKVYIDDERLEPPDKATIKPLWKVVQKDLGLDPAKVEDDDVARILSGITSVVDGVGALRTHTGSAHGRGRTAFRLSARHARLVLHASHTLAVFLIDTWDEKKSRATNG